MHGLVILSGRQRNSREGLFGETVSYRFAAFFAFLGSVCVVLCVLYVVSLPVDIF